METAIVPQTPQTKATVPQKISLEQAFGVRTVGALNKKIESYFEHCQEMEEKPNGKKMYVNIPTVNGLALWLGVCRYTLLEQAADSSYTARTLKRSITRIAEHQEQGALKGMYPAVPFIFIMKNNVPGYQENQETVKGNINVQVQINHFGNKTK